MYHASLHHFEGCGGLVAWRGSAWGLLEVTFLGVVWSKQSKHELSWAVMGKYRCFLHFLT